MPAHTIDDMTLIEQMTDAVDVLIRRTVAPLRDRLASLEAKLADLERKPGPAGAPGERGLDGKDGAPGRDGAPGERGADGKDGAPGRDGAPGERGPAGERGLDGSDGSAGERGERGEKGEAGERGIGIASVEIDPDFKDFDILLTDGTRATIPLLRGPIGDRGEKGDSGRDGASATPEQIAEAVNRALPALLVKAVGDELERRAPLFAAEVSRLVPAGRDGLPGAPGRPGERGEDGRDGADGLGFDDLRIEHDGGRSLHFVFERDGRRKEFAIELPLWEHRGTFARGAQYRPHDVVTYGGSLWLARSETSGQPGDGHDWQLIVKRGRDGRDAPAQEPAA